MEIKTKYNIGQEVFFVDPHCAGIAPGKGKIVKISFEQVDKEPTIEYWVKEDGWYDPMRFWEKYLFGSLSEFKDSMKQAIDQACERWEEVEQ